MLTDHLFEGLEPEFSDIDSNASKESAKKNIDLELEIEADNLFK